MSTNVLKPSLDAATLLSLWEEGVALRPAERALSLLGAAFPQVSVEEWRQASIGSRDDALLLLREALFGGTLDAAAWCSGCEDQLELSFQAEEIRGSAPAQVHDLRIELDGYEVRSRLPTSADLLEMAGEEHSSVEMLLARCIEVARLAGRDVGATELPPSVVAEVIAGMERADPLADIQVELVCPTCGQGMSVAFDIVSFLWSEIEDWAERVCLEVHWIAAAYGWSERDILAMSAQRRALYLEMQSGG